MSAEGLRSTLKKYRDQGRISSKLYQEVYGQAKGGKFKSEKAMLEHLHNAMAEADKATAVDAKEQAAKAKAAAKRARAQERRLEECGDAEASAADAGPVPDDGGDAGEWTTVTRR